MMSIRENDGYTEVIGEYWDIFSDIPFAADTISYLTAIGTIKGKTISFLISTQYSGVPTILDDKDETFIDTIEVNTPELEQVKNYYLKHVNIEYCKKHEYDNIICIVVDDPIDTDYPPKSECYIKNSILVVSEDKSYIINIGYSSKIYYEDKSDFVKKIVIPNN